MRVRKLQKLHKEENVRDRPIHTRKVSLRCQQELAKAVEEGLQHTIFPCLFAIMNEMHDQTASLEFQKLRIEVLGLLSNTQPFYKL
jgi:hypothetical protein